MSLTANLSSLLSKNEDQLLSDWMKQQLNADSMRQDLISESQLRQQLGHFLKLFVDAVKTGGLGNIHTPPWKPVLEMLTELSETRVRMGFNSSETATFIFSLKQPLIEQCYGTHNTSLDLQALELTLHLDKLGLFTTEAFQKTRESVIQNQVREITELSTPVIRIWDGILCLPIIGTLDSSRAQRLTESLLSEIAGTGAEVAIIDITGVPTVDTMVAQHILKTVSAARLMGADCIISGIRPQIAITVVQLGVSLSGVSTRATLAEGLALAFDRRGVRVARTA
jgi:rsbT co-antagonist protein RsbR